MPSVANAPAAAAPRVIVIDLPGTGQAAVTVALPGIRRDDPRYYAGLVANGVLGVGYSARLNEEIRIKRGLSYGAGSSLDARRGIGPFVAQVQTKNESAPEVVDLVLAEMRRLGAGPASPEELAARKAALTGQFGRNLEATSGVAASLSSYALHGLPFSEMAAHDDKVRAVTAEAAQDFAARSLDASAATIVVAGDAKAFVAALRAKFPGLELIEASDLDLDRPSLRKGG